LELLSDAIEFNRSSKKEATLYQMLKWIEQIKELEKERDKYKELAYEYHELILKILINQKSDSAYIERHAEAFYKAHKDW
jgi:hypothetical protein